MWCGPGGVAPGDRGTDRAVDAETEPGARARRPKTCLAARHEPLRRCVAEHLDADWFPEQVAGTLAREYPAGSQMRVSHETIYKSLFVQSRGVLGKQL